MKLGVVTNFQYPVEKKIPFDQRCFFLNKMFFFCHNLTTAVLNNDASILKHDAFQTKLVSNNF
jgi:hypothetical protein